MDQSELERELDRLHPDSWSWALACCGRDREVAQDALQSAYLRVFSGKARFDGRSSLRTWLFGVIRHVALEQVRSQWTWFSRVAALDDAVLAVAPGPAADEAIVEREQSAALITALAKLSPRQREVLQLVFYHDTTVEEAAEIMGVSIGSARTHYDRGKKALARELERGTVR